MIVVEMIDVLSLLTTGVFVAALAAGFGYLRFYFEGMYHQFHIKDGNDHKTLLWTVNIMVLIAICLVVVAYVLFGVAMWSASDALLR